MWKVIFLDLSSNLTFQPFITITCQNFENIDFGFTLYFQIVYLFSWIWRTHFLIFEPKGAFQCLFWPQRIQNLKKWTPFLFVFPIVKLYRVPVFKKLEEPLFWTKREIFISFLFARLSKFWKNNNSWIQDSQNVLVTNLCKSDLF